MRKLKYLLFLFLLFPFVVNAESVEYTLFDSNIKINENKTINVDENYKIYFIEDTNSINRKLNRNLTIIRPNESKTLTNIKVSNITSQTDYSIKNKDRYTNVNLVVDAYQDETLDYNLNYSYNLGKDKLKGKDEFYFPIVSNVDAPVSNLVFKLTFPTNIENVNVKFAVDDKYDLTEDDITYTIEGNVISGTLNKLLSNNQSLSIYVELPDNYFKGATDNFNYLTYLLLIFPLVGIVVLVIFYTKYGRGTQLKIKRMDAVPNNFDSAEIGYLYKGKLEQMDLTSLILYLANQGYLKIVEHDDGYKLGKENSFHFVKLKDYDRNNAAQELIFDELFRDRDRTELSDIEYHFADTFKDATSMLDNEDNHKKLFFGNLKLVKLISLLLIVLSVFAVNFNSIHLFTNSYVFILPVVLFILLGLYIVFISNATGILKIVIGGAIIAASLYVGFMPILIESNLLIIYIIGTVLITIMCTLYMKLSERTSFGAKVLSETYGLKYYLETISKQELEQKINENSNYYYDMIPYAYVLDSIDIWMQKGKNIITEPPSWYIPSTEFNMINFDKFIKNVIYTTTLVMMKQVYSESELITYENDKAKTNLND